MRAMVVVVCTRASARVCHSICAGHEERRVANWEKMAGKDGGPGSAHYAWVRRDAAASDCCKLPENLSLIHISEPTRRP